MDKNKKCKTCGIEKTLSEFNGYQRNNKWNYSSSCKVCKKDISAEWYKANSARILTEKKDVRTNLTAQQKENYKNKKSKSARKYYLNGGKEKIRTYTQKNSKFVRRNKQVNNIKRRALKLNCLSFPYTKAEIIKRDGLNCYLCGKLLHENEVTLDHVLPLSRAGQDKPENIKISCRSCNSSKKDKTLTEFKKYRGEYDYLLLRAQT